MIFGRITRNTNIGSEQVVAGEIVEVDDATFGQLKRAQAIVKCDPPEGAEAEVKKPAQKFKRHTPAKKSPEEQPAA
jgi:hypothetical protein